MKCLSAMDSAYDILVVDDDEVDRMAVRRALQRSDLACEIHEVIDGTDAIATLNQRGFDCVFLDYRLPDMDGLSLVQHLRQQGVRLPLIVLTGQGDEQIAVDLMKAGASDYLAKSRVTPASLSRLIHSALRVYEAELATARAQRELRRTNQLLMAQNKELEQQRRRIQRQNLELIKAARIKSAFLATMSHELRTPMNAIMGFSQILLRLSKGPLNDYQHDMVQRIFDNGKHLLLLLNDLLDLSRIEAGRLELRPEPVDLAGLVTETVEELRSLAEEKQLTLIVDFQLQDSKVVNDANRLRQVLVNLLSNAIKFTDQGKVQVTVKAREEVILIDVEDTGIGIASEEIAHIFDAFSQVDQTSTRKHSGTGLGLAIVDSLVRMMQGRVSVTSKPGQGTCFRVQIPRQVIPQTQADNFWASRHALR